MRRRGRVGAQWIPHSNACNVQWSSRQYSWEAAFLLLKAVMANIGHYQAKVPAIALSTAEAASHLLR